MKKFKIGDKVKTHLGETGKIFRSCIKSLDFNYDWYVLIDGVNCEEPYRESELNLL